MIEEITVESAPPTQDSKSPSAEVKIEGEKEESTKTKTPKSASKKSRAKDEGDEDDDDDDERRSPGSRRSKKPQKGNKNPTKCSTVHIAHQIFNRSAVGQKST